MHLFFFALDSRLRPALARPVANTDFAASWPVSRIFIQPARASPVRGEGREAQERRFALLSAGFRGYGCTDNRQSYLWKFLPSVLFLTLSNLLFIPAIIMSIYYRLYLEALIYFFNMFFSTVNTFSTSFDSLSTPLLFFSFTTPVIKTCFISASSSTTVCN